MQPLPTMHGKIRCSDILDSVHATLLYSHVTLIASAASSNDNACISCIIYLEKKRRKKNPENKKTTRKKGHVTGTFSFVINVIRHLTSQSLV